MATWSLDPWQNLGGYGDQTILSVGGNFYNLIATIAVAGIVAGGLVALILLLVAKNKRGEAKDRMVFLAFLLLFVITAPSFLILVIRAVQRIF